MGKIHALHSHSRERQSIPSGPREKPKAEKSLANQINMAVSVSCFLFTVLYSTSLPDVRSKFTGLVGKSKWEYLKKTHENW